MKMKLTAAIVTTILISGCASNQPFNVEQQALINKHKILVNQPNKKHKETLTVLTKSNKVGTAVAGVALGLFTGSIGFHSDGDTPRTRLKSGSMGALINNSMRKSAADEMETITPTHVMHKLLSNNFQYTSGKDKKNNDNLIINIKPVAWHLYYDKLFNGQETYLLEYASNVKMSLAAQKLKREFNCDKSSGKAMSKEDWLANDSLRIREFSDDVARNCVNQILTELGANKPVTLQPSEIKIKKIK